MNAQQVIDLPGHQNPVLLADGKVGTLVVYPTNDDEVCGVRVPGEEPLRQIHPRDLASSVGGALRQAGAPTAPADDGANTDSEAGLLALNWAQLGGRDIA